MTKKQIGFFIGVSMLFMCSPAMADHPTVAFGMNSAGSINTISAEPLPDGTLAFGIQTEVIDNDEFSTEQLENFADSGLEGVHSIDEIRNTSISVSYGISDDLSINARLPYIERKNIREGEVEDGVAEAHTHGDSSGLGDLLLLGQYRFLQMEDTNVSLNFGVKTPTGETKDKDDHGERFETEFQPGTGSWDYLLGLAVGRQAGAMGYHANILYNKTTEGSQSTEIGDSFSYNTAVTYRINGGNHDLHDHSHDMSVIWDLMLELNGETRSKNKISGDKEPNSGGNIVLLSPGVRASMGKLGGFFCVGFPIVDDSNGTQTDLDIRFLVGLSCAF